MDEMNIEESLQLLQAVIEQVKVEEQNDYIGWFFKRMQSNIRSIRVLLAERCDSDAHVIERVLLEHAARVLHFKNNPPTMDDIKLLKTKHEPSASKILQENIGHTLMFSMLSAFTHTDTFSLSFEDDLHNANNSKMTQAVSTFISWATITISLELLARTYPSVKKICDPHTSNTLSALVLLADELSASEAFQNETITEEIRVVLRDLLSWKVRDPIMDLLSQVENLSDIQQLIIDYVSSKPHHPL